jgi:hypothetical protein
MKNQEPSIARSFSFLTGSLARGALLCAVLLACQTLAGAGISLRPLTEKTGRYEAIEFDIDIPRSYSNPFDPDVVEVNLQITSPSGTKLLVPAFYSQEYERQRVGAAGRERDWFYPRGLPAWKARFAPFEVGVHRAAAILKDRQGIITSPPCAFEAVASESKGFVRVSRKDRRFFEFSEGQPFFPIGQNLAFIGHQQHVTLSKAEEIFAKLSANGANYLRIWACSEDWAMAIEARKSAWGRSWNWRPPTVSIPDSAPSRKCLQLTGRDAALKVDPSHPVALRPATRYTVTGKVRTEEGSSLRLEVQRTKSDGLASQTDDAWTGFSHEFETGATEHWLEQMVFLLSGAGSAWLAELSLKESAGGPELLWEAEVNRPVHGFYNPVDSFMLDELLAAAERQGLYLQLCLLTRDLYMDALKDPASPEYNRAIEDAKKIFRYAVGRWGYSTSLAAWEYWNEMNPNLPAGRFYSELGEYLEKIDVYRHLRSTSTWGPSANDCRHPKLDIADAHNYYRPIDFSRLRDEVDAVLDRARWLREHAPDKPALLAEFSLANDKWQQTEEMKQSRALVDFHNALWASALSGMSGTALAWWWERLDQREVYPMYRPLSSFIADVPWNSGEIRTSAITVSDENLRAVSLQSRDRAWIWLFSGGASWSKTVVENREPEIIEGATVELLFPSDGLCQVEWWDTRSGKIIRSERRPVIDGKLQLIAPPFARDIACKAGPSL